jgi:GNAT superfamily N-acetyltransferase
LNSGPFSIEKIKLKQIHEYARNSLTDIRFSEVSPISLIRAFGQAKNPHGDPEDISLVVGYENNRCVGYHGLRPGYLWGDGRLSKICWLVTFFLAPESRGKGYGKRLVQEIQTTGVDLVTTGITDAAENVYRSVGFQNLGELSYYRLSAEWKQLPVPAFDKWHQWRGLSDVHHSFDCKVVQTIGDKADHRQGRPSARPRFFRNLDTQNWMLLHPWVVSSHAAKADVKNYYFSRIRDRFKFIGMEFYAPDENQKRGHMILSISSRKGNTVVKVLDIFFPDPEDYNFAAYTGLKYAKKVLAHRLEFPARLNRFYQKQPLLDGYIKKKKRLYLYYPGSANSPLARNASKVELNYCDGDTAFT